jgi:hypothetical protein
MPSSSSSNAGNDVHRLKCNIDASFSEALNCMGIGNCVRDNDEAFVLAKTMSLSPLCSVLMGEALGLYHAIDWLSDMQMENVDFVIDSKTTVTLFTPTNLMSQILVISYPDVGDSFIHISQLPGGVQQSTSKCCGSCFSGRSRVISYSHHLF